MDPMGSRWIPPWSSLPIPHDHYGPSYDIYFYTAEEVRKAILCQETVPKFEKERMIKNYIQSYENQHTTRALCEAIIAAVNHEMTQLLPVFEDKCVKSPFSEALLQEMINNQYALSKHVHFLVMNMFHNVSLNCSGIEISDLLRKDIIHDKPLLLYFCKCGLKISESDFDWIVSNFPDDESSCQALEMILSHYTPLKSAILNKSCQAAIKIKKKKLGLCFVKHGADMKEIATKLIQEGNSFFDVGNYQKALDNYNQALILCHMDDLKDVVVTVHEHCCRVCIKLKRYDEAYDHADEMVQLKPDLGMGYFLRADVLCMLMESGCSTSHSLSYAKAVTDYCQSHQLKSSSTALCKAILIGVDYNCSGIILQPPAIIHKENQQLSCSIFNKLIGHSACKQQHLEFYVLRMLSEMHFSASFISLSHILHVPVSNKELIQRLIECNMNIKTTDVQTAAEILTDAEIDTFRVIVDASGADLKLKHIDKCCQIATKAKKVEMVVFLLEHGANPSAISFEFICHALEKGKWLICNELWLAIKPAIDEYCQIAADMKKASMVACLLEHGADHSVVSFELICNALEKGELSTCNKLWAVIKPTFNPRNVDICTLISRMPCKFADHPKFLHDLLNAGVDPNGSSKNKSLVEVLKLPDSYVTLKQKNTLVSVLLEKGADCQQLCLTGKALTTTPLHTATWLALEAGGDTGALSALVTCPTYTLPTANEKVVDGKGKTPFHLAVQSNYSCKASTLVLESLIKKHKLHINPLIPDLKRKKARDYIQKEDDPRVLLLAEAEENFRSLSKSDCGKKAKAKSLQSKEYEWRGESTMAAKEPKQTKVHRSQKVVNASKMYDKKLDLVMKQVLSMDVSHADIVEESVSPNCQPMELQQSGETGATSSSSTLKPIAMKDTSSERKTQKVRQTQDESAISSAAIGIQVDSTAEPTDMNDVCRKHGFHKFDGLPWEVEITAKVAKFLKDTKRNSNVDIVNAVRTIYQLAEGRRGRHLAKPVVSSVSKLNLYRAKMSKGGRILWEKAVQYSPRQTDLPDKPIYVQVIRIWQIIPLHDSMKSCIKHIESSFTRGQTSTAIHYPLLPCELRSLEAVRGRESLEIPKMFMSHEDSASYITHGDLDHFIPAASMREDEYSITHFYSFTSAHVKNILTRPMADLDFPFKVWPKEHKIITLGNDESILLLGRSGTGKTTCCLYRLWNEFKSHWDPARRDPDTKLPLRSPIPIDATDREPLQEEKECKAEIEMMETKEDETLETSPPIDLACCDSSASESELIVEAGLTTDELSDTCEEVVPIIEETLHQVFVTKNHLLCEQVRKRFFSLAAVHEFFSSHIEHQDSKGTSSDIPNSLSLVNSFEYPLFLTARQFYILLDNSLDNGKKFFLRNDDGSLKIKISSTDYNHEDADILLDFEESDDEVDDDVSQQPAMKSAHDMQPAIHDDTTTWYEVTSLYFKKYVWPKISHGCRKRFDPLLIWTEIKSFIKGSERALRKGSPLTLEEYKEVGNSMAPNFSTERESIFKLFRSYQEYCQSERHSVHLFDECDLVQNLYHRLFKLKDVPWSIHSFFIDEVQDFTQAELSVFLLCCRHPNSLFFTGDTAQSIMRGIAFRFEDLRSLFHRIHDKVPEVKVPKKPYALTVNFRSHSGVLKLAESIIDLLTSFFPQSIGDPLPENIGMFHGPTPVIIMSCEVDDLSRLLSSNEREGSEIEFGAHQVIIVQSKEAKDNLPDVLRGALALTIFEAKGLEFDDVLLYNFFEDSPVDAKSWRVVISYLEGNPTCINKQGMIPGTDEEPRSLVYDKSSHMSLGAEFKYLYTAITRAKCNLWIYDSHVNKCLPIFSYWYKRGLVEVVNSGSSPLTDDVYKLVFATSSTEDQWKVQGDYFKSQRHWESARHCYLKARAEHLYLAKEIEAFLLVQQARQHSLPQQYLEAAISFLECFIEHHDMKHMKFAARYLMKTQPPRHSEAANLYEKLGERARAINAYRKAEDAENCARLMEEDGQYSESVRILHVFNKESALLKAINFERKGIRLDPDMQVIIKELAYLYARRYARMQDKHMLLDILEYTADIPRRAHFYKVGRLFERAFEIYTSTKQIKEAFQLATSQMAVCYVTDRVESKQSKNSTAEKTMTFEAWFDKAQTLAESVKDEKMKALVVFQKIKLEFMDLSKKKSSHNCDQIKQLRSILQTKDPELCAHTNLILGRLLKDVTLMRTASQKYTLLKHTIGQLEAFHLIVEQDITCKEAMRIVLDMCHCAADTYKLLHRSGTSAMLDQVVLQVEMFFNLQIIGDVYYTPQGQEGWLGDLFDGCEVKEKGKLLSCDHDEMLRLDVHTTRDKLSKRYRHFESKWLEHYYRSLSYQISRQFELFDPHKRIRESSLLSHVYSISSTKLNDYIANCINECELAVISGRCKSITEEIVTTYLLNILCIFSPQVAFFLPLKKEHVLAVRGSHCLNKVLQKWISRLIKEAEIKDKEGIDMNLWLRIWRVACLIDGSMTVIYKSLEEQAAIVNSKRDSFRTVKRQISSTPCSKHVTGQPEDSLSQSGQPVLSEGSPNDKTGYFESPPAYLLWRKDNKYYHLFIYWLRACDFMKNGQASFSSRCIVNYFFLGARKRNISVMNLVNMFAVHSTSLLAILTHVNHLQGCQSHHRIPYLYRHIINLFDDINSQATTDKSVMAACAAEVATIPPCQYYKIADECQHILRMMLDILLGYRGGSGILAYSFQCAYSIESGAACNCLILTLTMFANVSLIRSRSHPLSKQRSMKEYQQKICSILKTAWHTVKKDFLREMVSVISSEDYSSIVFPQVTKLLKLGDARGRLAYLLLKTKESQVCFVETVEYHRLARQNQVRNPGSVANPIKNGVHNEVQSQALLPTPSSVDTPLVEHSSLPCTVSSDQLRLMDTSSNGSPIQQQNAEQTKQYSGKEDDDLNQALSQAQQSIRGTTVENSPELLATTVIDNDFCHACYMPLCYDEREGTPDKHIKIDEQARPRADPVHPVSPVYESYNVHIRSQDHITNVALYNKSTVQLKIFNSLTSEVGQMLLKCHNVDQSCLSLTMVRLIDDMKDQREMNESRVREHTSRRAYAQLNDEMDVMCDKMHSWLRKTEAEYREIELQKQVLVCQTQVDMEEVETEKDVEALHGPGATLVEGEKTALQSAEEKIQSREKKKRHK